MTDAVDNWIVDRVSLEWSLKVKNMLNYHFYGSILILKIEKYVTKPTLAKTEPQIVDSGLRANISKIPAKLITKIQEKIK